MRTEFSSMSCPQEQAKAAALDWKEHTAPDGRKYYYNKCAAFASYCHTSSTSSV